MARPNSGEQPPSQPLSPYVAPPAGVPMPVPPAGPYGPGGVHPSSTAPAANATPTLPALLYALKRRWVMATFLGGLIAGLVAAGTWFALPAGNHKARALVQLRTPGPEFVNRSADDFESFRKSQIFILRTRDLINRTLAEPSVASLDTIKNADDPVRYIEEGLKVTVEAPDILAVTLPGDNPDDLKVILDNLVKRYIDDATTFERNNRDRQMKSLERLAEMYRADIHNKELNIRRLAEASATSGQEDAAAKAARIHALLERVEMELFLTEKERQELDVQIRLLKKKLEAKTVELSPTELAKFVDMDYRVGPLLERKALKEYQLSRARQVAGGNDNAPTIVELKTQIEQLDKEIAENRKLITPEAEAALKTDARARLEARVVELNEKLVATDEFLKFRKAYRDELAKTIQASAKNGIEVSQLMNDLNPLREMLHKIEHQYNQLRAQKEIDSRVSIRESAVILKNENLKQKVLLASAGGLVTFFGVLALIGFMEWRTRRINGVDQVVTDLGMRVIGTVPAFPNRASLRAADAAGNANWRFVLNESINSTRTMLLHTARHQSMQVVMVTSATQGEGKTSLASQLATSMATAGMRTLIVDCDLRNPSIHKLFDLSLTAGVSEVLLQEADAADAVQPTAVPNLWVIPAGQCSNRVITALAQGHPLETLFNRLRGQFDFIIVDSCPVLPVADALLIGQHVDGVVFSIMQDVSQLPKVLVASEKLALLNIPLVGAVVNGIRQDTYSYGYNYVKQLPA